MRSYTASGTESISPPSFSRRRTTGCPRSRGLVGETRSQPWMLSDGGHSGAGAGREADGEHTLRNDKRALGGERGRGEAEREDALRQRERERGRLWGAAP